MNKHSSFNLIALRFFYSRIANAGKKVVGWQLSLRFVAKVSTLANFFSQFFHLSRCQFKGGYTHCRRDKI